MRNALDFESRGNNIKFKFKLSFFSFIEGSLCYTKITKFFNGTEKVGTIAFSQSN